MNAVARLPEPDPALVERVRLELHIARLRVAIASATLQWADAMLTAGNINPDGALGLIDEALDEIRGAE